MQRLAAAHTLKSNGGNIIACVPGAMSEEKIYIEQLASTSIDRRLDYIERMMKNIHCMISSQSYPPPSFHEAGEASVLACSRSSSTLNALAAEFRPASSWGSPSQLFCYIPTVALEDVPDVGSNTAVAFHQFDMDLMEHALICNSTQGVICRWIGAAWHHSCM